MLEKAKHIWRQSRLVQILKGPNRTKILIGGAAALLLLDGWLYLWHRANHRVPLLWRFHRMHHADPAMDVTTATRFHLGEHLGASVLRLGLIPLFGVDLSFPGYLIALAIVYAAVGTLVAHAIGKPLIPLQFRQQRYESDFRFAIARVTDHAESVALMAGERIQTPLRRVLYLGSAREGTGHFWRQRLTAVANVPLVIAFVVTIVSVAGRPYPVVVARLGSPLGSGIRHRSTSSLPERWRLK